MITIKNIQNNATVTDGTDTITLGAGDSYTCEPPVINEYMELVIDTTIAGGTASDSFSLACWGNGVVDWGEGAGDEFFSSVSNNIYSGNTHQYSVAGIYTIRFKGHFKMEYRSKNNDKFKIIELKNCGSECYFWEVNNMFGGCANMVITATDTLQAVNDKGIQQQMFYNCDSFVTLPKIPTYNTTTMFEFIASCALFDDDLGYMDLRLCNNFTNFANGNNNWSTENYGNTLMGWLRWDETTHAPSAGWVLKSNQNFHGGNSTLVTGSEAALARDYLINTLNWTITDGGLI